MCAYSSVFVVKSSRKVAYTSDQNKVCTADSRGLCPLHGFNLPGGNTSRETQLRDRQRFGWDRVMCTHHEHSSITRQGILTISLDKVVVVIHNYYTYYRQTKYHNLFHVEGTSPRSEISNDVVTPTIETTNLLIKHYAWNSLKYYEIEEGIHLGNSIIWMQNMDWTNWMKIS